MYTSILAMVLKMICGVRFLLVVRRLGFSEFESLFEFIDQDVPRFFNDTNDNRKINSLDLLLPVWLFRFGLHSWPSSRDLAKPHGYAGALISPEYKKKCCDYLCSLMWKNRQENLWKRIV